MMKNKLIKSRLAVLVGIGAVVGVALPLVTTSCNIHKNAPVETPAVFTTDKPGHNCVYGDEITVDCNYTFHIEQGSELPAGITENIISDTDHQYINNNSTASYKYEVTFVSESETPVEFTIDFVNGGYSLIYAHLLPSVMTSIDTTDNYVNPGELLYTTGTVGGTITPSYPLVSFYNSPSNAVVYCDADNTNSTRQNECYIMNDRDGTTTNARYQINYYSDPEHTDILYTLVTSIKALVVKPNSFEFDTDDSAAPVLETRIFHDKLTMGYDIWHGRLDEIQVNVSPVVMRNGKNFASKNDSVSISADSNNKWNWDWDNWNLKCDNYLDYSHVATDVLYGTYTPDANDIISSLVGTIDFTWRVSVAQNPFKA